MRGTTSRLAEYLFTVGSCERKLQYCRQILANNRNFIPGLIFSYNSSAVKHHLDQEEFVKLCSSLRLNLNKKECVLVFDYFREKGQTQLSYLRFHSRILPNGQHEIIRAAKQQQSSTMNIDYELQHMICRLFLKIVENYKILAQIVTFSLPKADTVPAKVTIESLNKYLNGNGKYPNELILEAIVREIDMSKLVNLDCTDVAYAVASFNANESKKMTINAKTISVKQTEEQPINSLKSTNLVFPHSKAIGLKDNHLTQTSSKKVNIQPLLLNQINRVAEKSEQRNYLSPISLSLTPICSKPELSPKKSSKDRKPVDLNEVEGKIRSLMSQLSGSKQVEIDVTNSNKNIQSRLLEASPNKLSSLLKYQKMIGNSPDNKKDSSLDNPTSRLKRIPRPDNDQRQTSRIVLRQRYR